MEDQAARLRQLIEDRTGYIPLAECEKMEETDESKKSSARIIAVTSGKGGVGKTNFAVNLAIALSKAGKRIILIDADLGMANVDVMLGTVSKYNLSNLCQDEVSLHDVLLRGPYGVNYISGGSGIEHAADFSVLERQRLMQKLVQCEDLADIILIDTGAGIGKNVLDFILAADEVILLTTPEPTSLTDAYAVMKAYSIYAPNKNMKLVVNRVYDELDSRDVVAKLRRTSERFLKMTVECLGYIYEDRSVMNAVRKQVPFLISYPDAAAAKCIMAIANNLLYGGQVKIKRGWKVFLQHFLDFSR